MSCSLLHPYEDSLLVIDVPRSPHDLATVGVVAVTRVPFDGVEVRLGRPLLEQANVIELSIPVPVETYQVTGLRIRSDGETAIPHTCVGHDIRHVCVVVAFDEALGRLPAGLVRPGAEHRAPGADHVIPLGVLALV